MADRKHKTVATWLAVLAGFLGAHRFYLHGWRDAWAWLHPLPGLAGLAGVIRMRNLGQDDLVSWALIPVFGLMISIAMLSAILIALTPDERWTARFNPGQPVQPTAWGPVLGAIVALLLGGAALMGTLAFGGQKFFEYQALQEQQATSPAAPSGAPAGGPAAVRP